MKQIILVFLLAATLLSVQAQTVPPSQQLAATCMRLWKDSFSLDNKPAKWTYDMGVILQGIEQVWLATGDATYFNYIQKQVDYFVSESGNISGYKPGDFNLDNINNGKLLLMLYQVTQKEKYLKAARQLYLQLQQQPRTTSGAFWHKKIYPNQQWLDGLYMQAPFYAAFASLSGADSVYDDIVLQFQEAILNLRDSATGLLYHAYDASAQMKWAVGKTNHAPHFWARGMGWFVAALVDVLDFFPVQHPKRIVLLNMITQLASSIRAQQDAGTGLWKDVLAYNGKDAEKNYWEASAAAQFVYFFAKSVRKGYLPTAYSNVFSKGYKGIQTHFLTTDSSGLHLKGTVKVSGLGGTPYRDGSFAYYMSEPVIQDDPKGLGATLLAMSEIERLPTLSMGKGRKVVMDNYFNRETKIDAFGNRIVFHYKWKERDNGGFSFVRSIWEKYGIHPVLLDEAPSPQNLAEVAVYFLIDPDFPKENKTPNYISQQHTEYLFDFVKNGGILIMMANDSNNVEFTHYNELAKKFGIQWNENMRHDVINNQFEQGLFIIPPGNPIFSKGRRIFIKQLCTQNLQSPAKPLLLDNNEVVMSIANVGKGKVIAIGDPWLYNEYVDGRKLPSNYENYQAAEELIQWLLKNARK